MLCKTTHFKAATLHSLKQSHLGHVDSAARGSILGASVLAPEAREVPKRGGWSPPPGQSTGRSLKIFSGRGRVLLCKYPLQGSSH